MGEGRDCEGSYEEKEKEPVRVFDLRVRFGKVSRVALAIGRRWSENLERGGWREKERVDGR